MVIDFIENRTNRTFNSLRPVNVPAVSQEYQTHFPLG